MFTNNRKNKSNIKENNTITYSDNVENLCIFYKKINMIFWCIILFALVEPKILIPGFIISIAIFYNKRVRLSWRVADFIEKLKMKQYAKAKDHLNKIEFLDDKEVYDELTILYNEKISV